MMPGLAPQGQSQVARSLALTKVVAVQQPEEPKRWEAQVRADPGGHARHDRDLWEQDND